MAVVVVRIGSLRCMLRPVFMTATAVAFLMAFCKPAFGEDTAKVSSDTFPAALGYAALSVISVAGGAMATVIGKLWYGYSEQQKAHQAEKDKMREEHQKAVDRLKEDHQKRVDELKDDHQTKVDELKDEHRNEVARLRDRLETEQKERREEAEKLLREQKEIMREVMVTCSAISDTLRKNTEAVELLRQERKETAE
jgi:Skp family chaperone for outer membrane proteins